MTSDITSVAWNQPGWEDTTGEIGKWYKSWLDLLLELSRLKWRWKW